MGQAGMRAHHGGVETVFFNIARVSDNHIALHTETLDIRIERADAVGQVSGNMGITRRGEIKHWCCVPERPCR